MTPIKIKFTPMGLGRVNFEANVMTADRGSLKPVKFKLDTASDFTTLSRVDLEHLGYTEAQLRACKRHSSYAITAGGRVPLRYIDNVSIKFKDREIQNTRVFFALGAKLDSLFGCDILKYFNFSVNYDEGEFTLCQTVNPPELSTGETPLYIYSVDT